MSSYLRYREQLELEVAVVLCSVGVVSFQCCFVGLVLLWGARSAPLELHYAVVCQRKSEIL